MRSQVRADNNGSMKTQTITVPTVGGDTGFTATQSYAYDSLNRLQSAAETVSGSQTWKQTFTFDRYGNRRFDAANTTTLGSCATAVCNPTIATSNNRFSTGQGYGYNANGDLTLDATGQRFGYDTENRQKEFFTANNTTSTPDATYSYDGEGKRVKKITSTETTIFVYDAAGQLAAEYSTQTAQTPQVSYLTTDHLGSPRVITDANGVVTSRKDFAAFGDETITAQRTTGLGYTPPSVRQDYTGYQKDNESGLEYAQARYYNSSHGRFTSVDPLTASASIRNPQTFNRYTYALNSPYKFTDPLGLAVGVNGNPPAQPRSDTCSAEFSSCDGGNSSSPGEAEYLQGLENTRDVNSAIGAIGRGDQSSAAAICASNPNLECQRTSTSVTVTVLPDPPQQRDPEPNAAAMVNIQVVNLGTENVDEPVTDADGNTTMTPTVHFKYEIIFSLESGDGSQLPDYEYKIQGKKTFSLREGSTDFLKTVVLVNGSIQNRKFSIRAVVQINEVTPYVHSVDPISVPYYRRPVYELTDSPLPYRRRNFLRPYQSNS